MVWIQLHNLPVDFWDRELLESLIEQIGIDKHTASLTRTKFAKDYWEIGLLCPLKRGFRLEDRDKNIYVVILYEKLPTFCYCCGLEGQGTNACNN